MSSRLMGLCLVLAGCQASAEVGWTIGPLGQPVAVGAHQRAGELSLRLALLGWDGAPLTPSDRVRVAGGSYRLAGLRPASAQLEGGRLLGTGSPPVELAASPRSFGHRSWGLPVRVVLLLDNSARAAAADPAQAHLSAARTLVQKSACVESCPLGPAEVALVAMEGGRTEVKMAPTRDSELLDGAIQKLAQTAGGDAPLWDGLLEAVTLARDGLPGGAAVVLLYTASGEAGSSRATATTVEQRLVVSMPVRLVAVQQQGSSPELQAAAGRSGGDWLGVGEAGIEGALRVAGTVLAGAWELAWPRPVATDAERMQGRLELAVGGERRLVEIDVPLMP